MNVVHPNATPRRRACATTPSPSDRAHDTAGDMPGLTVRISRTDATTTVLAVTGEVDLLTCDTLVMALASVTCCCDGGRVVVDLTGLGFLGACGVAALAGAHRDADRHRGQLHVVVPAGSSCATAAAVLRRETALLRRETALRLHPPFSAVAAGAASSAAPGPTSYSTWR